MRRLPFPLIVLFLIAASSAIGLAAPVLARVEPQTLAVDLDAGAPPIRLRATTFVPAPNQQPQAQQLQAVQGVSSAIAGQQIFLVQFQGPILDEWRQALEDTGATILDYIPDFAYKVSADVGTMAQLRQLPGLQWVGPYLAAYRVSPEALAAGRGTFRVELAGDTAEDVLAQLPELGARLVGREEGALVVEADNGIPSQLGELAGVQWVAPLSIPRAANDAARGEIRANQAWEAGFTGQGQLVNVADTGLDTGNYYTLHGDIRNRVTRMNSWPISPLYYAYLNNPTDNDGSADLASGHGTHVVGSALGSGYLSNGLYRGVAYGAQLTFQALEQYCRFNAAGKAQGYADGYWLVGVPADLNNLYAEAYNWGARVDTNSWGGDVSEAGVYNTWSRQTDQFVWEHRDMVILFATGNEGRDGDTNGRVDYGSAVPPSTAKNIIAVGGVENRRPSLSPTQGFQTYGQFAPFSFSANPIRNDPMADAGGSGMMAFSGRGPARDGRLMPDVVAPGTWIISMRSSVATTAGWGAVDNYYMYLGGTSMSTPLVAGGAALVRQAYIAHGNARPSAALIKATLIQSAVDIPGQYAPPYVDAGPVPNNDEGWGLINLQAAVAATRFFVDEQGAASLRTGQQAAYYYQAGASAQPARFTLAWTDPPAALEAARQLVNDLDLEVVAPDGRVYRGNAFSNGWSTTAGSADRLNNVECVYLPATQPGTYTVRVRGYNVPVGPQNFALLASLPPVSGNYRTSLPLVLRDRMSALPTPTPAPTPKEFHDDFSQNTGAWPTISTGQYEAGYLDGAYRLRVSASGSAYVMPSVDTMGWDDQTVEVDARVANDVSQAYGLLFNGRGEGGALQYNAFLISPSGYYALADQAGMAIVDWTPSKAIATGQGSNRLRVRRVGQQVQLYVNDTLALTRNDAALTGGTRFGLVALSYGESPYADARFDNFSALSPVRTALQSSSGALPSALSAFSPALLPAPGPAE